VEGLATTEEVAAYLKVKPQTLANWAYQGKGPRYYKIEGQRRYNWAELREWVEERRVGR
jgi:excisionase family DNA binding protein